MQNVNTDLHRQGKAVAGVAKEFRMSVEESMLRSVFHCICVAIM